MKTGEARLTVLDDYSLEVTGKDVRGLLEARDIIPVGSRVNVTFLGCESLETRIAAAKKVSELGFIPVPHISARRMGTAGPDGFITDLAGRLAAEATAGQVKVHFYAFCGVKATAVWASGCIAGER